MTSFMFEFYYRAPEDKAREARVQAHVAAAGGRLDYREPADSAAGPICLTFVFGTREQAESAALALRQSGEHIENVCDYE
jgi:hypothetical protein